MTDRLFNSNELKLICQISLIIKHSPTGFCWGNEDQQMRVASWEDFEHDNYSIIVCFNTKSWTIYVPHYTQPIKKSINIKLSRIMTLLYINGYNDNERDI